MKIAIVTDNNKTVSAHFGRAQYYLVYEIQDGKIMSKETRAKSSHSHHGVIELRSDSGHAENHHDAAAEGTIHDTMLSNVRDCEAIIARGMGAGMYGSIRQLGMKPYVTSIAAADEAALAYIEGKLDNHVDRLH
jgi:predicted Fe-Mo cluster-binding NifX family protein